VSNLCQRVDTRPCVGVKDSAERRLRRIRLQQYLRAETTVTRQPIYSAGKLYGRVLKVYQIGPMCSERSVRVSAIPRTIKEQEEEEEEEEDFA